VVIAVRPSCKGNALIPTGFAKLEYWPGEEFMGLFVRRCMAMQLEGFKPQALANVINGEALEA
jgi:hypothetical protein